MTLPLDEMVLKAETTWVFVSLATMRPERIADDVRAKLGAPSEWRARPAVAADRGVTRRASPDASSRERSAVHARG